MFWIESKLVNLLNDLILQAFREKMFESQIFLEIKGK